MLHTWSTIPSSEDRIVGWMSRCMCMMRLQRHMGGVARIGAKLSMTFELAAPPDVDAEPDFEADVDSEITELLSVLPTMSSDQCNAK